MVKSLPLENYLLAGVKKNRIDFLNKINAILVFPNTPDGIAILDNSPSVRYCVLGGRGIPTLSLLVNIRFPFIWKVTNDFW